MAELWSDPDAPSCVGVDLDFWGTVADGLQAVAVLIVLLLAVLAMPLLVPLWLLGWLWRRVED